MLLCPIWQLLLAASWTSKRIRPTSPSCKVRNNSNVSIWKQLITHFLLSLFLCSPLHFFLSYSLTLFISTLLELFWNMFLALAGKSMSPFSRHAERKLIKPPPNAIGWRCPLIGTRFLMIIVLLVGSGREVVFQCRDEGPLRVPVRWVRGSGVGLPAGSRDSNGRLEMPNIQVGSLICVPNTMSSL